MAVDARLDRATALAAERPGAVAEADWHVATARPDVDAVIVSTTNDWLAPVTLAAVEADKHVLVEKPAARTSEELEQVLAAVRRHRVSVWVGFNHRYHPAFQKAREIFDSGALGPLMFIRGRYGHGGRLGYEREWRADPRISGGGELLDQGIHLIDLARWFLGDFNEVCGFIHTYFWKAPVEDNAFLMLKTRQEQVAWLHVSSTEWKNLFSFEIYGRNGKLHIEGLGGSYGAERLSYYKRRPEMGPPETVIWEFPGEDSSWRLEVEAFAAAAGEGAASTVPLEDAKAALEIVGTLYQNFRPCSSPSSLVIS
jgi:predicted dehydrogenase